MQFILYYRTSVQVPLARPLDLAVQESCGRAAPMTDKENSACNALQAMRFTEGLGLGSALGSVPLSDGRTTMAGSSARKGWRDVAIPDPSTNPRSCSPSAGSSPGDASGGSGGRSSSHVRMRLHALLEDL